MEYVRKERETGQSFVVFYEQCDSIYQLFTLATFFKKRKRSLNFLIERFRASGRTSNASKTHRRVTSTKQFFRRGRCMTLTAIVWHMGEFVRAHAFTRHQEAHSVPLKTPQTSSFREKYRERRRTTRAVTSAMENYKPFPLSFLSPNTLHL